MKKVFAVIITAALASIMILGCAKQEKEETEVKIVTESESPSEQKIVINDEKPSETVERVPEEAVAAEETKAAAKAETAAAPGAETAAAPGAETAAAPGAETTAAPVAETQPTVKKVAEGDLVSNDYSQYAGKYTRTEDGSTFELSKDGKVSISIVRLTQMDGKADGIYKNIIKMTVKDANDGDMKLEFLTDTNELIVTGSTWSLLPNGETFKFDKKE